MATIDTLAGDWLEAKEAEKQAVERRRCIEDRMAYHMQIAESFEGTKTEDLESYQIKLSGRINRKVDAEKLQSIAIDYGIFDQLSSLFRWKPEINMKAWNAAHESITRPLAQAITAKPGRPSFAVKPKGK